MKDLNKFICMICLVCIILPMLAACKDVATGDGGDQTSSQSPSVTTDKVTDENALQSGETTGGETTGGETTGGVTPEKKGSYTHYAKMVSDDIEDAIVWKVPEDGEDAVISVVDRTSGKEIWSEALKLDYAREWGYYFCERTDRTRKNSLLVWTLHFSKTKCTGTFKYHWFYVNDDGTLSKIEEKSTNLDLVNETHIAACKNSYEAVRMGLGARLESGSDWNVHLLMRWNGSELVHSIDDGLMLSDGYNYTIDELAEKSKEIVAKYEPPQTTVPDPGKDDNPLVKMTYVNIIGDNKEELIKLRLPAEKDIYLSFAVYDMQTYTEKWGASAPAHPFSTDDYGYCVRIDKTGRTQNEILEYTFSLPKDNGGNVNIHFRTYTLRPVENMISVDLVDEAHVGISFGSEENIAMNRERFTEALEKLEKNLESNEIYEVYTIIRWDGEKFIYSDGNNRIRAEKFGYTFDSLKELVTKKEQ